MPYHYKPKKGKKKKRKNGMKKRRGKKGHHSCQFHNTGENVIDYIKVKLIQFWNILSGKDKNWDGHVDIKDKMIEAEEKSKGQVGNTPSIEKL